MAIKKVETTGHEPVDSISHTTSGSLTASHIVGILYDTTAGNVEILAALEMAKAKLVQVLT